MDRPKKTVFIVEDEDSQIMRLQHILQESYTLIFAKNAQQAQDIYFDLDPQSIDVILLDIRLPDMMALELLTIFENKTFPALPPIIIQTGYNDEQWIQDLLGEYRAVTYLTKPFSKEDIVTTIEYAMQVNPFVHKGHQFDEFLHVISDLNTVRYRLLQSILHFGTDEHPFWLKKISEIFDIYAQLNGHPNKDVRMRQSLKPVIELYRSFNPTYQLPAEFTCRASVVGASDEQFQLIQSLLTHLPTTHSNDYPVRFDCHLQQFTDVEELKKSAFIVAILNEDTYASIQKSLDFLLKMRSEVTFYNVPQLMIVTDMTFKTKLEKLI